MTNMNQDKYIAITLGSNIRKHRKAMHMSQLELAKHLGKTTAAYINFIENGERNINAVDLSKLASVLHVSFDELFDWRPSSKKKRITIDHLDIKKQKHILNTIKLIS